MRLPICRSTLVILLTTVGCGHASVQAAFAKSGSAPPSEGAPTAMPEAAMSEAPSADEHAAPASNAVALAAPMAAPPAPAPPPAGTPGTAPERAPAAIASGAGQQTATQAMLDIEAWLAITVPNVTEALRTLHALARERGGFVAEENAEGARGERASLTLRIPSGSSEPFFEDARKLGDVDSERLNVRDVGKEYNDAAIQLENLRATLHRYQEILSKAQNVEEIMRVESELARIRGEIERVEGNLRYMRDRTSQATVHVTLTRKGETIVEPDRPQAKFYPGLRFGYLADYQGQRPGAGYLGGGLSLRGSRNLSLDLEGFRDVARDKRGIDVFQITLGGEDYSDFLGRGKRQFLNPYLGLRAGYARFRDYGEAVAGGTLGLELVHTGSVTVDADLRVLGYFFGKPDAHIAAQPALGVNIAF